MTTMRRRRPISRAERNIGWIEEYCVQRGEHVRLSEGERETIAAIYPDAPEIAPAAVSGPLAAYLALLHICGPEFERGGSAPPWVESDTFTVWNASGPDLRAVLKRDGERITCPELGTRYPRAASLALKGRS